MLVAKSRHEKPENVRRSVEERGPDGYRRQTG
jgi:hypothetical protein